MSRRFATPDEIDAQIEKLEDRNLLDLALKKQLDTRKEIGIDFPKLLNEMRRTFRLDILKHD